jgi:protein-tyrosine phosphatase family protein
LLLAVLDVPHETIIEDYLLTNTCDILQFTLTQYQAQLRVAAGDHPLLTMPDDNAGCCSQRIATTWTLRLIKWHVTSAG